MRLKEQLIEKCHNSVYFFDLFKKLKNSHKILISILFVLGSIFTILFAVGTQFLINIPTIISFTFAVILSLYSILIFFKSIKQYAIKIYPHLLKSNERFTVHTLEKIQKFKLENDISYLIPIDKNILWNLITSFKDDLKIENVKNEKNLPDKLVLPLILFILTCLANHIFNNLEFGETLWLLGVLFYVAATVYAVLLLVDLFFTTPRKERKINERKRLIAVLEEKYFDESN